MKKDIIICDLDGTLCNIDHRLHFVQATEHGFLPFVTSDGTITYPRKDWDAFFAGVPDDKVNEPVLRVLQEMTQGNCGCTRGSRREIIFCSGRPERCRADTVEWLHRADEYMFDPELDEYKLYMRQDGDFRRDDIVKQEILDKYIDKERVLFVLDDRDQVVHMWRHNGLTCFQVAEGDF